MRIRVFPSELLNDIQEKRYCLRKHYPIVVLNGTKYPTNQENTSHIMWIIFPFLFMVLISVIVLFTLYMTHGIHLPPSLLIRNYNWHVQNQTHSNISWETINNPQSTMITSLFDQPLPDEICVTIRLDLELFYYFPKNETHYIVLGRMPFGYGKMSIMTSNTTGELYIEGVSIVSPHFVKYSDLYITHTMHICIRHSEWCYEFDVEDQNKKDHPHLVRKSKLSRNNWIDQPPTAAAPLTPTNFNSLFLLLGPRIFFITWVVYWVFYLMT